MNLALHGFLLQVFVSILNFRHGRLLCSAGEPGYLDFDNLPETNFSCQGKVIGGYYADVEAGCQMFHVCTIGQKDEIMDIKFLCLNGTVFDQETRVCERVDEVDCSKSERFYNLNLELYGNNAVTLSLHEDDDEDDLSDPVEDHQPRTTSARPSTTSTTSTTTSRPSKPSTTAASGSFQHPAGYPQHYQPQPPFPQIHTSQSKSLYDDKNGGYHHQYIFHNDERANNQATSYQLFSNQGVSSTTVPPPPPQIHQIRFSSTVSPQIIHNEPSTVTPLFHATSPTIQTLLNSNANSPALINPIFHNHGIASTTEQFTVHSNNPRETSDYRDEDDHEQGVVRPLEALQPANKGKVSKLSLSPGQQELSRTVQTKTSQTSQQQRIPGNFLPTPATVETTVRSFYPTPRSPLKSQSHSVTQQITQHIHVSHPGVTIPQLKPHQITINLPPPDIQRIVQNPPPLLPSQSRVIVTAKASVSDESGRPLNTTQLVTLPLPTIPASYDDYKEGDESFDPFYRDVPKIRKNRRIRTRLSRKRRSLDRTHRYIYEAANPREGDLKGDGESRRDGNKATNEEDVRAVEDLRVIKESLIKFRDILFSDEVDEDTVRSVAEIIADSNERAREGHEATASATLAKQAEDNAIKRSKSLEDLMTEASKHLSLDEEEREEEDAGENQEEEEDEEANHEDSTVRTNTERMINEERYIEDAPTATPPVSEHEINIQSTTARSERNESREDIIDVIILDSDSDVKTRPTSSSSDVKIPRTDAPIEIIFEEETKSGSRDVSKTSEKVINNVQVAGHSAKDDSIKRLDPSTSEEEIPQEAVRRKASNDSRERKGAVPRRKKGSRSRSSRRRISSKVKQQRTDRIGTTEAILREEEETYETTDETITTVATTPTATTTTTTTTAAETTVAVSTTTMPSVTLFEDEAAGQIDSHLFDEPESQTSKEVDTRAIGQHDTSKSLLDGKSRDTSKSEEMERSFDHQVSIKHRAENAEQPSEEEFEEGRGTESTDRTQISGSEDTNFTENSQSGSEVAVTEEVTDAYEERQSLEEERFTEYESLDDESTDARTSGEQFEESSEEPNKILSSRETFVPDKDKSEEEPFYRDDENDESSTPPGNLNEEERSVTKNSEETSPEESNEYRDTTESTVENTRADGDVQKDYEESKSTEDSTMPMDYTSSFDEYTDSQEDGTGSTEETRGSTEGVLKFTDELPRSDHTEYVETEEVSESEESDERDYVDDNYEPENYKQLDAASKSDGKKSEVRDEEKNDEGTTARDSNREGSIDARRTNESTEAANARTEHAEGVTEVVVLKEAANSTTTTSSTTTSTTTPRPTTTTTTTSRPTPPKLFKPISARRTYAFIAPTTTPNPVVIKPRLGLFNPKPAKPLKSYNDLAPKPVIRKLPLLSRTSTTVAAIIVDDSSVGSRETTTTMTTTTTTTAVPITTTTPIATTIATESTTTTTTTTPMSTTESSRSEENVLESKELEARNRETVSLDLAAAKADMANKEDQFPSPSEQDSSANPARDVDSRISDKEMTSFTPYPISRLSSLAPTVEQSTARVTAQSERETATESVVDVVATRAIPSSTTLVAPKWSEHVGETTSTGRHLEETEAPTTETAKSHHWDVTEPLATISERPATVSHFTTVPTTKDADVVGVVTSTDTTTILGTVGSRRTTTGPRRYASFNCLEKEMYRFYGDARDCRLFHYCSPGFTARQVLDFRFVCEEGTAFDEETQSCRHEIRNRKCRNRSW